MCGVRRDVDRADLVLYETYLSDTRDAFATGEAYLELFRCLNTCILGR
jgi:hypothetical protein